MTLPCTATDMEHMTRGLLRRWRVEPWVALRQQALYSVVGPALEVSAAQLPQFLTGKNSLQSSAFSVFMVPVGLLG